MINEFIHVAVIFSLTPNPSQSKSQSFWYPVWFTKDLGSGPNQDVQVGSDIYQIPVTSTDTPVHVDLIPDNIDLATSGFPKKVNFLTLKNKQCLLKIPLKRGKRRYERRFVAISEGVFPHPEDNERFVVCHKKQNGNLECLDIDCLKGTYFDAKDNKCRYKNRNSVKTNLPNGS